MFSRLKKTIPVLCHCLQCFLMYAGSAVFVYPATKLAFRERHLRFPTAWRCLERSGWTICNKTPAFTTQSGNAKSLRNSCLFNIAHVCLSSSRFQLPGPSSLLAATVSSAIKSAMPSSSSGVKSRVPVFGGRKLFLPEPAWASRQYRDEQTICCVSVHNGTDTNLSRV